MLVLYVDSGATWADDRISFAFSSGPIELLIHQTLDYRGIVRANVRFLLREAATDFYLANAVNRSRSAQTAAARALAPHEVPL